MDEFKERLRKLREKRKQLSHSNFKEVLEENERNKRPANWEKRLERNAKKLKEEEEKQKAREQGLDYEGKKNLTYQVDEVERWDRFKASKRNKETEFVDFEVATKRQYDRFTKQLKPNMEEYKELKERVGEEIFYPKEIGQVPESSLTQDSKEGVERMVEDVHKQIEVRSKRSRRRKFDDEADIDYINERNMRFNKKLERSYGKYTEEIKQNFERGTAI